MHNSSHQYIINAIYGFCAASEEDIAAIAGHFVKVKLKRNDYFLKEGQVCTKIGFLDTGKIRHYYNTGDNEVTRWMSLQHDFTTSLHSFILQIPSIESLQAIEDCELVVFDRKALL